MNHTVELQNGSGCIFDRCAVDDLKAVLPWAADRNGETRIVLDGEPLEWKVRIEEREFQTYWHITEDRLDVDLWIPIQDDESALWDDIAAFDEQNGTSWFWMITQENVRWCE